MRAKRSSVRLRRLALIVLASVLLLAVLGIAGLRFALSRQQQIEGPRAVHESGYVPIGGRQQWIELRGWDRTNPVLLWVHGGPGFPVLSANYASFLPWERSFTIALWHQRGAGLTYAAASKDEPLTIDRMVDDGIEVAEYIRSRLGAERIVVVGHSWGSLIAARMVQRQPNLFVVYVGTGQFTNLERDGRDLFAAALERATRAGNTSAIHALEMVASLPPTDVHRMDVVRTWGKTEDVSDNPLLLYLAPLLAPGYPVRHAVSFARGLAQSRADLFEQELRVDMERDVPELARPAFLFQGRNDWQVSTPSALHYFKVLKAPRKEIVLFEGGHLVPMLQPDTFLKALVDKVRPLAVR
jgi:pimeloyl-ACP methyl ester carboxylesterase